MRTHAPVLALAFVGGGMVMAAAACGMTPVQPSSPTTVAEPTVTVTTTAVPTATPVTVSPTGVSSADPGACTYDDLRVSYADDAGGAGAGSVMGTFTFTNVSSTSCTLTGFPGVSYVGHVQGDQIGAAASRTDDAVTTVSLPAKGKATAALRRTQPGNYGDTCDETKATGFEVYPPNLRGPSFVTFATTACKNTAAPLLQVGSVRR